MFENAKWITRTPWRQWRMPSYEELPPAPYLTKSFDVEKAVASAVLNIVAYGQGAYFINGKRIPDSYLPTVHSLTDKTLVYSSYDLAGDIVKGKNKIGVVIGNGFQTNQANTCRGYVRMIAQLDITYKDGTAEQIVSNTSWKTADSPILFDMRRCGEKFDARLKINGWCDPDFDDSAWDNAFICKGLGGKFRKKIVEPIRIMRLIRGTEIEKGLFDFGTNTSGWARINVKGKRGNEIVIKYSENLTEDKRHVDQSSITNGGSHKDQYIMEGNPNGEEWEQTFIYHGFRYVEIEGEYDEITVDAVVAFTDMPLTSSFSCDNDVINKIHQACINSIQTNCHDLMTDCPHREQNFWTGDAAASAEAITMSFNAYNMLSEWAEHFKDSQLDDGQLPCIVPPFSLAWEYLFATGPDWDSAIIHLPYYAYKYSGKREIVDTLWENMNKLLGYFETRTESRILNFGLGDWACFSNDEIMHGDMCPIEISDTCFYRIDALMMAEMAEATGRDSNPYLVLADEIKSEFRNKFIIDGKLDSDNDTAVAMSLFAGMYEKSEEQAEADRLAKNITDNDKRLFCGIHGARTIFDMLTKFGYTQLAFDVVTNDKYPGYAASVKAGLDTLPESFRFATKYRPDGFLSLNHHFFSHINAWFYKTFAGIKINGFGFDDVVIEPVFVEGINELTAESHGIKVSYNSEKVNVSSPYPFTFKLGGNTISCQSGEYVFQRQI